jgi:methyltransferase
LTNWSRIYTWLLLLLAAQRLAELAISRRSERRSGPMLGTAAQRSYPAMVVLHCALFALPLSERRLRPRAARLPLIASSLVLLACATALRVWVIRTLGNGWNVRGRVPAQLRVVDTGPYRFARHPNYVAVAVEMAALPLAAPAPISAGLLSAANAAVLFSRIREEEALLAAVPGYTERMAGRPRFIPRIRSEPATAQT